MIVDIIILLMLLKLNMFNGWFLALWIIEVVLHSSIILAKIIKNVLDEI